MADYATLAEVKLHYGIASAGQDAAITAALARVTAMINAAVDRDMRETDWAHTFDGLGSPFLFLREYPIVDVNSITEDGGAVSDSAYVIYREAGYLKLVSSIDATRTFGAVWARDDQNIVVNYKAGYLLTGTPSGNQVLLPEDIKLAAILFTGYVIDNPSVTSFISERIGNYSYRKQAGSAAAPQAFMPDEVWSLLVRYKRRDMDSVRML